MRIQIYIIMVLACSLVWVGTVKAAKRSVCGHTPYRYCAHQLLHHHHGPWAPKANLRFKPSPLPAHQ